MDLRYLDGGKTNFPTSDAEKPVAQSGRLLRVERVAQPAGGRPHLDAAHLLTLKSKGAPRMITKTSTTRIFARADSAHL